MKYKSSRTVIFFIFLQAMLPLHAEKTAKYPKSLQSDPFFKESQKFAKVERDKAFDLISRFSKSATSMPKNEVADSKQVVVHQDDFLPSVNKGQVFDEANSYSRAQLAKELGGADIPEEEKVPYLKLENASRVALRKEKLDGSEKFLIKSKAISENPPGEVGILSETVRDVAEEVNLKTCQEGADYQTFVLLSRTIQIIPEERTRIKVCKGHEEIAKRFRMKNAEKLKTEKEKSLAKDSSISSSWVTIEDHGPAFKHSITTQYIHKNDTQQCDCYYLKEEIAQEKFEQESWEADRPEDFSAILGNPNCVLIAEQIVGGPETRIIDGNPYYRDLWTKKLMFSCSECDNSGCQELRKKGGYLVKKECLQELSTGECTRWKKVYDLGSYAAHDQTTILFEGEEIYGFEGWEVPYEKNNEIGETLATFSTFTDVKKEMEAHPERALYEDALEIFKGDIHRCQCTVLDGVFFDCCKKMQGLTLNLGLAKCSQDEKVLAERRQEGKCHFVGTKELEFLGTDIKKTQCYCCFPTKLARVINEEGRKQLGIDWGTYENPNCSGFSLERMRNLAFDRMDLTEVVEEFENKIKKDDLTDRLQSIVAQYNSEAFQEGIKEKTRKLVEDQKNVIKERGSYVQD